MPISVQCSCGKTLKVDEKHRGKKAKCPACGNSLIVEEKDAKTKAKTAIQTKEPKRKPAPKPDDDADPDDAPEDRPSIKRKKKAKGGSKMLLYAGGGCSVLLFLTCCLAGVGGGVWYLLMGGAAEDMAFVHDGVAGFTSFRAADIWKSTVVQDQLRTMDKDAKKDMDDKVKEMETKIGLKIDDLERMTFIIRTIDITKAKPDFGAVIKTSKPMDRKKIIEVVAKEKNDKEKEVKHEGGTIYVFGQDGKGKDSMALFFPSDQILLMCEKEQTVKDFLRDSKKANKNPALVRGIQMASSGKHQFVAAFELKKDLMDKIPAEMVKQAPNLKSMNGLIFAGTLTKDLALEMILTFPSADNAGKAKKDVDDGLVMIKGFMKMGGDKAPAAAGKFLDSLTVEQRSAEVAVKGKLDLDLKGFGPMLPFGGGGGMAGGGGGPKRIQSVNNMKQIMLAMHSFHDANKSLPNHAILNPKTGQPLLSWRVSLLPYLDEAPLYNQIKRDEPWDSNHNKQFWAKMPRVYQMPGIGIKDSTYYQIFQGNESAFPKSMLKGATDRSGITLVGVTDGTSNTIGIIEAGFPVNWMQPQDISFQKGQGDFMLKQVGNHWGDNTFNAGMLDGTVRSFRRTMPPMAMQGLITRNGNEVVNWGEIEAR